jgi:hypothetical protein
MLQETRTVDGTCTLTAIGEVEDDDEMKYTLFNNRSRDVHGGVGLVWTP